MVSTNFFVTHAKDFTQRRLESCSPKDGSAAILYHLRYVPPYEQFGEIKRIQLLMHMKIRESSRNKLTVDLTEWINHTSEEYFTVTLRFLADFADMYQPQFLLICTSEKTSKRMMRNLQCYFTVNTVYDKCFEDISEAQKYLTDNFTIVPAAAKELAQYIVQPDFPHSYMVLDRLMDELHSSSNGSSISKRTIQQLTQNGTPSAAALMNSMKIYAEQGHKEVYIG